MIVCLLWCVFGGLFCVLGDFVAVGDCCGLFILCYLLDILVLGLGGWVLCCCGLDGWLVFVRMRGLAFSRSCGFGWMFWLGALF